MLASRAEPERLTDIESWHQHIPFAFALIKILRPRIFVELGTHRGDSYCAFCQAVREQGETTYCYAVDTWMGDPQAGEYGPEVLEELRQHHDPRYGHFSTLMQMHFDDALKYFADGSIDLLHIDGLHTEEAVWHDFTSWLPKLSPSSVVLFHDIAVHKEGFGVWRVWEKLAASYPSFHFEHGNGLGVLLPGDNPPQWLLKWCVADQETKDNLRRAFSALGERLQFRRHLDLYRKANEELWERTNQCETEKHHLEDVQAKLLSELFGVQRHAHDLEEELAMIKNELDIQRRRAYGLEVELGEILNSTSWKITIPLRIVGRAWRALRGKYT